MGGIAAYLKEVAEAFAKCGHKVTVIAASDDTRLEYEEEINGVRVIRLKGGDFINSSIESSLLGFRKFRMIYRFHSYRRRIRKAILSLQDVDVIEVGEYGAEAFYLFDLDIPITIRLHTPALLDRNTSTLRKCSLSYAHEYWVGKKELQLMPKAKAITSCSHSLLNWMRKYVSQITPNAHVIYNPVNTNSWDFERDNSYDEYSVLFVGTVAESKGVGDLVEACAGLHRQGISVVLTIAGKLGTYGRQLMDSCGSLGYDWCRFTGHLSRKELKELYKKNKVSCFPSWWENMPMVCLEAMAVGNLVIGSSNGGMAEIITDGEDGYL
ncbi:MAG: glycosyltransferase family 4 protein, partial [Muribaculaceae bacterium]|nr:glycosyltransferase family 4 protein [Muribaculaceae bacterium]